MEEVAGERGKTTTDVVVLVGAGGSLSLVGCWGFMQNCEGLRLRISHERFVFYLRVRKLML